MKSEKAKSFIDNDAIQMNNGDRMIDASTAYTAVELAEQEAEERMREKAKRAFIRRYVVRKRRGRRVRTGLRVPPKEFYPETEQGR